MVTVNMTAQNAGTWLYHCHVAEHAKGGMHTTYTISK
ncbi:MAG: multicopper oxidase domain-containing protein [Nitrospirales bacterium]